MTDGLSNNRQTARTRQQQQEAACQLTASVESKGRFSSVGRFLRCMSGEGGGSTPAAVPGRLPDGALGKITSGMLAERAGGGRSSARSRLWRSECRQAGDGTKTTYCCCCFV